MAALGDQPSGEPHGSMLLARAVSATLWAVSDGSPKNLAELASAHGTLTPGRGMLSGVIALSLAVLALLGVIGFHFPAYTSTPELR